MNKYVQFISGHTVGTSSLGMIEPVFSFGESVRLVVVAGDDAVGEVSPSIVLSKRTFVGVQHRLWGIPGIVNAKGAPSYVVVGDFPTKFVIAESETELASSEEVAKLKNSARAEITEHIERLFAYQRQYNAALKEEMDESPVANALTEDTAPKLSVDRNRRNIAVRTQKLNDLLVSLEVVYDGKSDRTFSGMFELVNFLTEEKVSYNREEMFADLSELPIADVITLGGEIDLPQFLPNRDEPDSPPETTQAQPSVTGEFDEADAA